MPVTGTADSDPWRAAVVNRVVGRIHGFVSHHIAPRLLGIGSLSARACAGSSLYREANPLVGGNGEPLLVAMRRQGIPNAVSPGSKARLRLRNFVVVARYGECRCR